MTPAEYCEQIAAPLGSDLYYSIRYLDENKQEALIALFAFYDELMNVYQKVSDPGVARVKLYWWKDQVAHIYQGHADHLVSKALKKAVENYAIPKSYLDNILQAVINKLKPQRCKDVINQAEYCNELYGNLFQAASYILGFRDQSTLELTKQLALSYGIAQIIRELKSDIAKDHLYLSEAALEQFNVPMQSIYGFKMTRPLKKVLKEAIKRAKNHYQQAAKNIYPEDRALLHPLFSLSLLQLKVLKEIRYDRYRVFKHQVHLTPVRKLWITYRVYHKYKA